VGLLLGALTWLTYQATFLVAAGFLSVFLLQLLAWNKRGLLLTVVAGVAFTIPLSIVVATCLRRVLSFASGIPGWAPGVPGAGLGAKVTFAFAAWFNVLKNNLTFLPWGWPTTLIAAAAALVIVAGISLIILDRNERARNLSTLLFLGSVAVVFSCGAYLRQFPLGVTRHTFVLQIPVLLALGLGLSAFRISARSAIICLTSIVIVAAYFYPRVVFATQNRVNQSLIEAEFSTAPDARIVDLPGSFTWNITYLARSDPTRLERIRWNNQFRDIGEMARFLAGAPRSFAVSHRAPMSDDFRKELLAAGVHEIHVLAAVAPIGSTELSGNLNGGNGFYFYQLDR
jgi:hypothetical protein